MECETALRMNLRPSAVETRSHFGMRSFGNVASQCPRRCIWFDVCYFAPSSVLASQLRGEIDSEKEKNLPATHETKLLFRYEGCVCNFFSHSCVPLFVSLLGLGVFFFYRAKTPARFSFGGFFPERTSQNMSLDGIHFFAASKSLVALLPQNHALILEQSFSGPASMNTH